MWISDKWQDYELIDCSSGEKLERWGKWILVRPDPQAIGTRPGGTGAGTITTPAIIAATPGWLLGSAACRELEISYGKLSFNVKPMNFKHTGIFPNRPTTGNTSYQR